MLWIVLIYLGMSVPISLALAVGLRRIAAEPRLHEPELARALGMLGDPAVALTTDGTHVRWVRDGTACRAPEDLVAVRRTP